MRVAIYSRKSISTDAGESIKNQIKLCKEYFNRQYNDCKFEIFEDEGFSGGNINRPSFKRMMNLVKIKQFDVVTVYKIDRIARNIVDFVNIYDELDTFDVRLVSVTEGFDPSTPGGKMMMLLLASFAEMERMNIAQRVKDNMKELAKIGHWSGGTPPTGYKTKKVWENNKRVTYLDLIKDKSLDVKEMFIKYSQGYSIYKISTQFHQKGKNYPNKTIQNILTNPTYLISSDSSVKYLESQGYTVYGEPNGFGFLPYNRRPRTKGKKSWNDKNKFVGISKHTAIIDLDLWIKVHQQFESKSADPHPRESQFSYLTGLVKCKCGSGMCVEPGHKRKDGTRLYYFRCSAKRNRINLECNNKSLRVDLAEKFVLENIKKYLDKEYLKSFLYNNKKNKNFDTELQTINKKIKSNDIAIKNLVDKLMFLSNDASMIITDKIEELTKQNVFFKEELLKIDREKLLNSLDEKNIDVLYNQMQNFIKSTSIESKRICIKNIVKKIVWDSDKNTLHIELLI